MSSPTDETKKQDDHLKYAPKWARDRGHNGSPGIADNEFPLQNEQSLPVEDLSPDEVEVPLQPDSEIHRDTQRIPLVRRPRSVDPRLEKREQPISDRDSFHAE